MYTYTVAIKLKNSSCMTIVGLTESKGKDANAAMDEIYETVMYNKDPEKAVEVLKKYGVNVWLNEAPYCTSTMREERDEDLKKKLTEFFKQQNAALDVASKCILPINTI